TNLVIEDKNIILADVTTPTDTTADGAGITIKGATDKTLNWVQSTKSFTTSEPVIINNSSTDVPTLIVKLNTGQTSSIQEWRDHVGNVVAKIGPLYGSNVFQFDPFSYGAGSGYSSIFIGGRSITNEQRAAQSKFGVTTGEWALGALRATDNQVGAFAASTTLPTFVVKGVASQTSNLQEWQDSTGAILAKIDNSGTTTINSALNISTSRYGSAMLSLATAYLGNVGVIIRGMSGQTANLQEWQDSSGTTLTSINSSGSIVFNPNTTAAVVKWGTVNIWESVGSTASMRLNPYGPGYIGLIVKGASSQSANLQEWQNSGGTVLAYVDSTGRFLSTRPFRTDDVITAGSQSNTLGQISAISSSSTRIGLVAQGAASQTANLQEWQNSAGTTLAKVDSSGNITAPSYSLSNSLYSLRKTIKKTVGDGTAVPINTTYDLFQ
ncbi:hypothetical protein EB001_26145, partial [bacterium]|nr:hypothetical protein [bacterium]